MVMPSHFNAGPVDPFYRTWWHFVGATKPSTASNAPAGGAAAAAVATAAKSQAADATLTQAMEHVQLMFADGKERYLDRVRAFVPPL
jgi:hypothetical protein